MGTMLEVRGLWAGYTDFVVRDVSFTVAGGELVGILGRNGSGKSTLLRGLTFGLRRRQGQVLVRGEDCAALSPRQRARRMALLPQHTPSSPGLRVEEVLELGRYPWEGPLRPPGSQTRELVRRAAEQFGIEGLLYRDCAALSQGQRQLVQLARVAVQGAPVLLLDEPNSALDFPNTHQFFRTLTGLLAGGERCALVVLHDPALALRWCGRLLLLEEGRLIGELRPGETGLHAVQSALGRLYPGLQVRQDGESRRLFCAME